MNMLMIALLVAVAVYLLVTRGLPQLLSWLCYRKLHIRVKIGHIGILSLSLGNVVIRRKGMHVAIDSIGISSSLVNRTHNKLLVIYVNDVRIQKDEMDIGEEKTPSSQTFVPTQKHVIPNSLVTLTQILSLHICNVDIVLLDSPMECLVHCSMREVRLEGSSDCRLTQLMLNFKTVTCKLLQPVQHASEQAPPCLAELSVDVDLLLTFDPKNDMRLKVVSLHLIPEIILTEGIFPLKRKSLQGVSSTISKPQESDRSGRLNEAIEKFENMIPEEFNVKLNQVKIKVIPSQSSKILACDLKNFAVTVSCKKLLYDCLMADSHWLKSVHIGLTIAAEELTVMSSSVKFVTLNKILVNIMLEDGSLDVDVTVSSLGLLLSEEELVFWKNASPLKRVQQQHNETSTSKSTKFHELFEALSSLQLSLQLWDIELTGCLTECTPIRTHCTHTKISVDLPLSYNQGDKFLVIWQQLNSAEVLVETVWCKLDGAKLPDNLCKKHHYWNTLFFMGMFLLTVKHPALVLKWQGMIDNLQLEWSPMLLDMCKALTRFVEPTSTSHVNEECSRKRLQKINQVSHDDAEMSLSPSSINIHLRWTNVNIFFLTNKKVGILVRVDALSAERQDGKTVLCSEGIKILMFSLMNLYYPCLKSSELKHSNVYLDNVILTYKTNKDLSLQLLENADCKWTTKLHLVALEISEDLLQFKQSLAGIFSRNRVVPMSSAKKTSLVFSLKMRGSMRLQAILSQRHKLSVNATTVTMKLSQHYVVLQVSTLMLMFDDYDILAIAGLNVSRTPHNDQLTVDRETYSDLTLKENKACIVTCDDAKMKFPHQYSLAEAFSEETINIVKWLKTIHEIKKQEFTADSPLPADLLIKIKNFTVEFCDDPFEVKLRDNFELLEDEYKENQKRWKMLDARIEELRKTHLMLPTGKVEELYANLQMKNTDVYIQRSRQMYSATPMRTSLGLWHFTTVEILSLADLSYHGKENVIKQMKDMDVESPFPEEGLQFTTLWCRMIRASWNSCTFTLRDFPSPVLDVQKFHVWGRLAGAEQEANKRAKRTSVVEIEPPWSNKTVERSLTPLKFYHDFSCEIDHFAIGYGPCWEPAFAQLNLSMEHINKPSSDPSLPLPFWDKMRLLFHGRLTMFIQHATMILHASLDPYNTTEEMDFSWTGMLFDWTNGQIVFKGDLDVYIRTASKYDDCHFLHLPNFKLSFKLDWLCLADPNDHHSVMPCAPDKLPEYSSNQEHDSYRAFRSMNLNMSISMETRSVPYSNSNNIPLLLFYSSTLRWLENLKNNMSSVARPIRRGRYFHNCRPRKLQLGRHYKSLHLSLSLHQFEVCYWMSFARLRGFHLKADKLTMSSGHTLNLLTNDDALIHRMQAEWCIAYMNCELNDAEIWLQSAAADDTTDEMNMSFRTPVEKCYFLSLKRVSYVRETAIPDAHSEDGMDETPMHKLVLHDLKGAWTKNNKDIVFSMFDSYVNIKLLRRNLSTEALKGFKVDNQVNTASKSRGNSVSLGLSGTPLPSGMASTSNSTPTVCQQSSPIIAMLQQLVSEADTKTTVYTEDLAGGTREQQLHGVAACQIEDALHHNWRIELINSQVLLKGCETSGYVIMSAAKAQILQRIHQPVWQDCRLVTKTTWKGSLECMQYYATVDPGELSTSMDNIMWLTVDNIEEKESMVIADLPDLVGSGQGVGGVISGTVGGADPRNPVQLQRIVSRCNCQFFYASYGENIDPKNLETVPPLPLEDDTELWTKEVPVDSFTLMHHDLNICTNSLQYAMILDILNNLLLFVEPKKKEYNEKLQRMRFQLQLSHIADQRTPILQLQNQVRILLSNLRRLEREIYILQRAMDEDDPDESLIERMDDLERQIYECKVQLNAQSEELAMMIWCFKEQQLAAVRKLRIGKDSRVMPSRWNEVCFKHAQWRLTEIDGQLGIADVVLSNFLYSKQTKNDDSVEHLLELGDVRVTNLLPNQMYKIVFQPTNLQGNVPFDRQCAVRIFCREKPPVGGISIKEHLEVNVVPLTLGLTTLFYKTMLRFCFPGKETETVDKQSPDEIELDNKSIKKKHGPLRRAISIGDQDDIEKMKERAEKNKMFLYIKIPEVPVKLSFKAEKEKNIKDVHDFTIVVPTLEYHNVTWTWLDFLLAMKNDSKKALLSQAIKQKLQIKMGKTATEESTVTQEEDKVRLLLGSKLHAKGPTEKEKKRTLFSRSNK